MIRHRALDERVRHLAFNTVPILQVLVGHVEDLFQVRRIERFEKYEEGFIALCLGLYQLGHVGPTR